MEKRKRREKKQFHQYALTSLVKALEAVEHGRMNIATAARTYGVPRSTLKDKVHGKSAVGAKHGCKPYMTPEEENRLEQWALQQVPVDGKSISKQTLEMAHKMIKEKGISFPIGWLKGKPGIAWLNRFMQRHPNLREYSRCKTMTKPLLSSETLDEWFLYLQEFVKSHDCRAVLMSAERMWSVDGAVFPLDYGGTFVTRIRRKGDGDACPHSKNAHITVLQAISAAGSFSPPAVCYPEGDQPKYSQFTTPDSWLSFCSKDGKVTPEAFLQWLDNLFYPYLESSGTAFPVLLLVNGEASYISDSVGEFCTTKRILLYMLPVNSSHILQPLELAVFNVFEEACKRAEQEWIEGNSGDYVANDICAHVLSSAWEEMMDKSYLAQQGFADAGLFPFDGSYNRDSLLPLDPCESPTPHRNCATRMEEITAVQSVAVEEPPRPSQSTHAAEEKPKQPSQKILRTAGMSRRTLLRRKESNRHIPTSTPSKQHLIDWDNSNGLPKDICSAKKQLQLAQRAVMHLMKDLRQAHKVCRDAEAKERMAKDELYKAEVSAGKATAELKVARKKVQEMKSAQRDLQVDVRKARKNLQRLAASKKPQRDSDIDEIPGTESGETVCTKCELPSLDDNECEEWVACSSCPRWFHVQCTDLYNLAPERIAKMEYMCPFCKYG